MEKFSFQDKEDIKKYVGSLEKILEQDKEQAQVIKSAPKLFKMKYRKI